MISQYSVKKPFTVLVAVILVLVLGAVSVTRMTPDLLPKMSFPYIVLVTSYVGAAPEEVETTVTKPMEDTGASRDAGFTGTWDKTLSYSVTGFQVSGCLDSVRKACLKARAVS